MRCFLKFALGVILSLETMTCDGGLGSGWLVVILDDVEESAILFFESDVGINIKFLC